jgi:predicted HAD superfamily Cof-like phosphohydrolase
METIGALGVEVSLLPLLQLRESFISSVQNEDSVIFSIYKGMDLVEVADGCADLKVVTIGTEVACGIPSDKVWSEVHRSNMSKFIDGHKREDGKWVRGPAYSPANLQPILEEASTLPLNEAFQNPDNFDSRSVAE